MPGERDAPLSDLDMPRLCGSLSRYPVSLGAVMHNAGYRALGLAWHYMPFKIDDLASALSAMRSLSIRGLGISMPFKLEITSLVDDLEPLAARIGAVNTVVNDAGRLRGHNTDWIGVARAIEEVRSLDGARVLMLGAGGAARAVAHGVLQRGARLTITNRNDARARQLAHDAGAKSIPYAERHALSDFDIVVNASSRGMSDIDASSPIDATALHAKLVVLDAVYKPLDTALIQAARACGAHAIDGSRMLLHQAAAQFELYTERPAPLEAMAAALKTQLDQPTP
jgi:shikimate dehydrogenase